MPPFNYSEEPVQLFISSADGKTYEPFTELKDVEIVSDDPFDPLDPNQKWACCPRDVGFSATLTLTNDSAKTIKKWSKAIRKYVNRRNRRCKRAKERVRKVAWRACKGKPPKEVIQYINMVIDDYYSHNWCPSRRWLLDVPAV